MVGYSSIAGFVAVRRLSGIMSGIENAHITGKVIRAAET